MALPRSDRHAFISYVHEDKAHVDELQEVLEAAGISVWRDTKDLWPGEDWEAKIRAAIKSDSLAFIACFSAAAEQREKSYQNEELTVAAEEYRLRRPGQSWLFTVRFDECEIPHLDLGAKRSLDETIQRTDVFEPGKAVNLTRLITAVKRIVEPTTSPTVTTALLAATKEAESAPRARSDQMKALLRDPNADILLDDFMHDAAREASAQYPDESVFPTYSPERDQVRLALNWVDTVRHYDASLTPVLELVRLAASYGLPQQNTVWERFMTHFTKHVAPPSGSPSLIALRGYPTLVLIHVAAIAASARRNYEPLLGFVVAPQIRDAYQPHLRIPAILEIDTRRVASEADIAASALVLSDAGADANAALIAGVTNRSIAGKRTPLADHLHWLLRDLFSDDLADDRDYDAIFDRAEVLLDALSVDESNQIDRLGGNSGGYGRYTWRYRYQDDSPVEKEMLNELEAKQGAWPPVLVGLFGGSVERARVALESVGEMARYIRSQRFG